MSKFTEIITEITRIKNYYIGDDTVEFKSKILYKCIQWSNNIETVKFLVECGLEVKYDDCIIAIKRNNIDIVKYLDEKHIFDNFDCIDFMQIAIKRGNLEMVKFFIQDVGLDNTSTDDLLIAISSGFPEMINYVYKMSEPSETSIKYMKKIGLYF